MSDLCRPSSAPRSALVTTESCSPELHGLQEAAPDSMRHAAANFVVVSFDAEAVYLALAVHARRAGYDALIPGLDLPPPAPTTAILAVHVAQKDKRLPPPSSAASRRIPCGRRSPPARTGPGRAVLPRAASIAAYRTPVLVGGLRAGSTGSASRTGARPRADLM